jgi:uncharacterized protein (TIGR03643 family)
MSKSLQFKLSEEEISRIVEMAWEDRTPFEAIELQFGLSQSQIIVLMRVHMKTSSFKMWRERVTGRKTKHLKLRGFLQSKAYAPAHYKISRH